MRTNTIIYKATILALVITCSACSNKERTNDPVVVEEQKLRSQKKKAHFLLAAQLPLHMSAHRPSMITCVALTLHRKMIWMITA